MSTFTLERAFDLFTGVDSVGPATRFIQEKQQEQLASDVEELANIRFSIVITAKWANSPDEEPERRKELRDELDSLRYRYNDKIDRHRDDARRRRSDDCQRRSRAENHD